MGQKDLPAKLQLVGGNPNHRNTQRLKEQSELEDKLRGDATNIDAPEWLEVGSMARRVFNTLKKDLSSSEILSNTDSNALAMYCDALQQYVELRKYVKKELETDGKPGNAYGAMDKAAKQVRAMGSDLGLSPSSRAKLVASIVKQDKEEEEWN
jgi:P27 family predicted phage terminase small subunit